MNSIAASGGRKSRDSALSRAEERQLQATLLLSQQQLPQQQILSPPPLHHQSATPFPTIHGTLDNTTVASSTSSDRIVSSISNCPTNSHSHSHSPSIISDDISNNTTIKNSNSTLPSLPVKSFPAVLPASSTIETSSFSNPFQLPPSVTSSSSLKPQQPGDESVEMMIDEEVPDSDNEGSGFGSASHQFEGIVDTSSTTPQIPPPPPALLITPGHRLPSLPKPDNTTSSSILNTTTATTVPPRSVASKKLVSNSSTTTKEKGFVLDIPQRTVSASKPSLVAATAGKKGKDKMLSKEIIDSEDDEEEVVLKGNLAKTKKAGTGGKRTLPVDSDDEDEPSTKTKKVAGEGDGEDSSLSSPETDYEDPPSKPKSKATTSSRTSTTTSTASRQRKQSKEIYPRSKIVVPPSSSQDDELALKTGDPPLESNHSSLDTDKVDDTSTSNSPLSKGQQPLVPRGSEEFLLEIERANAKESEDDSDYGGGGKKKKGKGKGKAKKETKGKGKVASPVINRKPTVSKSRSNSKNKQKEPEPEAEEVEEVAEKEAEIVGNDRTKSKGKGKVIPQSVDKKKKKGVVEDSEEDEEEEEEEEEEGFIGSKLTEEEKQEAAEGGGSRRSPRANKGKAKAQYGEDQDVGLSKKKGKIASKKGVIVSSSQADSVMNEVDHETKGATSSAGSKSAKGRKKAVEDDEEPLQEPTPSASTIASISKSTRASRVSVSPAVSRQSLSKEERSARTASMEAKMKKVEESAQILDPNAFNFPSDPKKASTVGKGKKRKAVETDSDADDEEDESDADMSEEEEKDKGAKAAPKTAPPADHSKENAGLGGTVKPKSVSSLARERDRSASPFSKTPKPGSLAALMEKKGIASHRAPGLSSRFKVPSLHTNLKPPPPAKKVIKEVQPKKKKKKGEESYSDEDKPWYEKKDPEEWDSDDHARWRKRQKRIEKGLPADSDRDSD